MYEKISFQCISNGKDTQNYKKCKTLIHMNKRKPSFLVKLHCFKELDTRLLFTFHRFNRTDGLERNGLERKFTDRQTERKILLPHTEKWCRMHHFKGIETLTNWLTGT